MNASNTNPAVALCFHVKTSQITRIGKAALETTGAPGTSVHINLQPPIDLTFAGLLHGLGPQYEQPSSTAVVAR